MKSQNTVSGYPESPSDTDSLYCPVFGDHRRRAVYQTY